jgi:hypothetical protein
MLETELCVQQRWKFIVADTPPSHRDVKLMQTFVKIPVTSKAGLLSRLRVTLLGTVSGVCASEGASRTVACGGLTIVKPQGSPTSNHAPELYMLHIYTSAMAA